MVTLIIITAVTMFALTTRTIIRTATRANEAKTRELLYIEHVRQLEHKLQHRINF